MGKPTGFLEYTRREDGRRPAAERVRDWEEFHLPLPEEIRRQQGARCMNCGVPFCQAGMIYEGKAFGCPLHNLIPEWNDMILSGNWGHALSRLLKANSFPEFTGRVCPAPCENACICGIYGDPITVRDNELSIIEAAFGAGKLRPRRPPQWSGKKVCVVGSGPAGLAAADQLNRPGPHGHRHRAGGAPRRSADVRHPQYEAAQICGPAAHRPDDRGGRHLRLRCGRLRGCRGKAAAGGVRRGDPLLRGRSAPALGTGHHRHLRRMLRHPST